MKCTSKPNVPHSWMTMVVASSSVRGSLALECHPIPSCTVKFHSLQQNSALLVHSWTKQPWRSPMNRQKLSECNTEVPMPTSGPNKLLLPVTIFNLQSCKLEASSLSTFSWEFPKQKVFHLPGSRHDAICPLPYLKLHFTHTTHKHLLHLKPAWFTRTEALGTTIFLNGHGLQQVLACINTVPKQLLLKKKKKKKWWK